MGGSGPTLVDVRVIAATNKDLRLETQEGRFRKDLFYRLNVMTLQVPSLAQRRDDIPLLVDHFTQRFAEKNNRPTPRLGRAAMEKLRSYHWPGNVRQLEHVIERAVILCRTDVIADILLPEDPVPADTASTEDQLLPPWGTTLQENLLEHERRVIIAALKVCGGVQAQAARRLGLSRSNLNYRIQRLGIEVKDITYE